MAEIIATMAAIIAVIAAIQAVRFALRATRNCSAIAAALRADSLRNSHS